jgi:hypothetical protein
MSLPGLTAGWKVVPFMIDTGAARTILHPAQATSNVGLGMSALLDPSRWPRKYPLRGVGGQGRVYEHQVIYALERDDGTLWQSVATTIYIAQPDPQMANYRLPSLLGRSSDRATTAAEPL